MVPWDRSFFRKSALFWPIARPAAVLERFADWPAPEDLAAVFGVAEADAPVRFVRATRPASPATPRPRGRRKPLLPPDARYDARIALERTVSTRPASWHDLLNALVWASFPRAKMALHARQHRMIAARLQDDLRLPGARTREQDAVAMLDEGGVAVLCPRAGRDELRAALASPLPRGSVDGDGTRVPAIVARGGACAVIFGHALYEGLVCGSPARVYGAAFAVEVETLPVNDEARVATADAALAALLSREAPVARADFGTIAVDEGLRGPRPERT